MHARARTRIEMNNWYSVLRCVARIMSALVERVNKGGSADC